MNAVWGSIFDAVPARTASILGDMAVPLSIAFGFAIAGAVVALIARAMGGGD